MKIEKMQFAFRLLLVVGLCALLLPGSATWAAAKGSPQATRTHEAWTETPTDATEPTATPTETVSPLETPTESLITELTDTPQAAPQTSTGASGFQTNQIIISYQPSSLAFKTPGAANQMALLTQTAGVALQYFRSMSGNANVLKLPAWLPLDQVQMIADHLAALPGVAYAEPDQILFPALSPNDTYYVSGTQWDLNDPIGGINVPAAWDITTGSSSVVVAITDTGLTNHVDLSGRMVSGSVATSGYDFISDSQVANDGNGRDSDPSDPGDWITSAESQSGYFAGCPVSNSSWHGTHVAGTIGAASNNSQGVAGINWNSKLLIVRVLGKCGGYDSDIADGITWAAGLSVSGVPANANPAKVISISLGGSSSSCPSSLQTAVTAAVNAGTVVVVAAGNSNANVSGFTPANCTGVIAVTATGKTGSRASYSNYGSLIKISAPGGDGSYGVLSTVNSGTTSPQVDPAPGTYASYEGTSMATPHVTGVVSLMFSVNPSLTPAQVLQILQGTARAFPGGSTCNTSICGSGIVNAAAAVSAAQPSGAFNKTGPANGAFHQSRSPALGWGSSARATVYSYCIDTTNNNVCDGSWISVGSNTSASVSGLSYNTTFYWQVRASNGWVSTYADNNAWGSFTTGIAPDDFDGDGKSDPVKYDSSVHTVSWLKSGTGIWGSADMGTDTFSYVSRSDFDGDGKTDPAKFVPAVGAVWYLKSSTATWEGKYMGPGSYAYVSGSDYDGDGKTDPAEFISANALWYLQSGTGTWQGVYMGPGSYTLVNGSDYDGDGKTDPALFVSGLNALWYLKSSTGTWQGVYMGPGSYQMVAASDFDGDGKTDPALFVPGTNVLWYLKSSTGTWQGVYMGSGTYSYVSGCDFDGDGKTDPAEFVSGTNTLWYLGSSTGTWQGLYLGSGTYDVVN